MHELASQAVFDNEVGNLSPDLLSTRGWVIHRCRYPVLDVQFESPDDAPTLRINCDFSQWSTLPPSVMLCDGNGDPLRKIKGGGIFNAGPHHKTSLPFVCMAGVLEYHEHPSHVKNLWDDYKGREGYSLGGIVTQIWRGWQAHNPCKS